MFLRKFYRLACLIAFLCLPVQVWAQGQIYNPIVQKLIQETNYHINQVREYNQFASDIVVDCLSREDWISFQTTFVSHKSFLEDWGDLARNECLREDIWTLEDQLTTMNEAAWEAIDVCNPAVEDLQNWYATLEQHIRGLRVYGEHPDLEAADSQNCATNANCRKAQIVGMENLAQTYASAIYTESACPLSRKNAQKWSEAWGELKANLNLFKNIKSILKKEVVNHSWTFTSEDYATAQQQATSWYSSVLQKFSYNGQNLQFSFLINADQNQLNALNRRSLQKEKDQQDQAQTPPPQSEADIIQANPLTTEAYRQLQIASEKEVELLDLAEWKSEMETYYQGVKRPGTLDLEDTLIETNNQIVEAIEYLQTYTPKLKTIVNAHCSNLYPPAE